MDITHTKDSIVTLCNTTNHNNDGPTTSSPKQQQIPSSSSPAANDINPEANLNNNDTNSANDKAYPLDEPNSAKKDDSSSFSTAFTISFEDETNAAKRLSIKDSIRKFAPPKPNTIEKPRPSKLDQNDDNSFNSIESAPGGFAKHAARFERLSAKRSSERKSNSSMQSNISDSAAFLIDKMLNPDTNKTPIKDNKSLLPKSPRSRAQKELSSSKHILREGLKTSKTGRAADGVLDGEVEFCEERSDNGTYIVGADPESEAARKKIDELFGVVKAAEASVIADSVSRQLEAGHEHSSRRSRASDKKPISRERQERIDRLARRSTSASRSSSSSNRDNSPVEHHQSKAASRGSRNSSCDRTFKPLQVSRPRRSTSQSSRHSSGRDASENDTQSSKSSLHIDNDLTSQENQASSHPNMKFNRAFALRRARLGLGDPVRNIPMLNQNLNQESETMHNYSTSQRGTQLNSTHSYRAIPQSTGSANFSRDDGGRFSLRMRNNLQPNRIPTSTTDRPPSVPQHNSVLESLINRVASGPSGKTSNVSSQYRNFIAHKQNQQYSSVVTSTVPYQSSDEQEALSPSRYRTVIKSARLPRKAHSELDQEEGSPMRRLNYSVGNDQEPTFRYESASRAGSGGGGGGAGRRGSNSLQLGALDSLVISAISSLSLKIRHSVCDVLIEQAKKLPNDNETRLVVEEILPQLVAPSSGPKSPTSIEEIDQSLYFDLAKTLKNLKKVEQMVDVINLISNQLTSSSPSPPSSSSIPLSSTNHLHSMNQNAGMRSSDSAIAQKTSNSLNDLSPV